MASIAPLRDQFAKICSVRTPTSGRICKTSPELLTIFSEWSSRSPTMKKNLKNSQIVVFNTSKMEKVSVFDVPVPQAEGQSISYSPDGKLSAVLSVDGKDKEKKHFLRIIDLANDYDKHIYNLSAKKLHASVHLGGDFGGGVFSPSGKYFLYTAEKKQETVEFFDADLDKPEKEEKEGEKKPAIGDKFLWKETFGEQTFEVDSPVLCLLTVETGEVKVLDSVPSHLHPVQKLFSADESTIYFGAIDAPHYRLGKVFCTNRPYTIGRIDLKDFQYSCITEKVIGLEFLRRASDGTIFGVCRTNSNDSHQGSYSFFELHPTSTDLVVEKFTHADVFLPSLSNRCFTLKGAILFSAVYGSFIKAFKYDVSKSQITRISPENVCDTILDVFEDYVLVQRLHVTQPPELHLGKFISENEVTWTLISKPNPIVVDHTCEDVGMYEKYGSHTFVRIPKNVSGKIPLIAFIHGGPHSVSLKAWPRRAANILLSSGFAVVQINYPGSIGFGEDYVQQLPGKVGQVDVEFCEKMIEETLTKFPQLDKSKVGLLGGSHGGFLVTHLAGNKPENYKAVVALNPVLNVRTMLDITDIPDWCAYEANCAPLQPGKPLDATLEKQMLACSPATRSHAIRAPFLLVIGGKDLRVSPHFRSFVRGLSANGVTHKVLYYPESNHALDEVDVETDVEINTALWFQKYAL